MPFMPTRGIIGTDYLKVRPDFRVMSNPYGVDDLVVVPAINPRVAVFHAFRADREGNVIADRNQNNWLLAQAAETVIVTVITSIHVDAVVHAPHGAHPTSCRGYYGADGAHVKEYLRYARAEDSFREYLEEYVYCGEERYREQVGVGTPRGGMR